MAAVLFIYPDIDTGTNQGVQHGICAMSSLLKKRGHSVFLYHILSMPSKREFMKKIRSFQSNIILFSGTTNQFRFIKRFAEWLKENDDIPVLVGGIHATLCPEEVIRDKNIDMLCRGEGELPILELVDKLAHGETIDNVENLWIKRNGEIIKNSLRPLISDLDKLPFPDYELFDYSRVLSRNNRGFQVMAGRGCPYSCTYCCNYSLRKLYQNKGKHIRHKSVDYLLQEIDYIESKYRLSRIDFEDDIFTFSQDWLGEFCQKYPRKFTLPFSCNVWIGSVNEGLLFQLKEAGCTEIKVGIESGNEQIRKNLLKRNISNRHIIQSFEMAKRIGLRTYAYNMIGLPSETKQSIEETIKINRRVKPDIVQVSVFYPYPSTELGEMCREKDLLLKEGLPNYFEESSLKLPTLSQKEFRNCLCKFNRWAMSRNVETNYPLLKYPLKLINYVLGNRARRLLFFLRNCFNNIIGGWKE